MPDPTSSPSPMPAQPGSPQGAPGAASQGQPPIGSSPATQPVPNRGLQAAGLAKLGVAVRLLESLLPTFGAGSEAGKAILESLNKLAKHVQPGSNSSGVEQTAMQDLMNKARQNAPQIAAARAAQPQPGGGAGPQMPPGGGGAQIPPQLLAMMQKPRGTA